jgi:hypothetical protein
MLALVILGGAACSQPACTADVLRFGCNVRGDTGACVAEVICGSQTILRFRGGDRAALEARGQAVVSRLTELTLAGLRAEELSAKPNGAEAQVVARGLVVADADAETAQLSKSTPLTLAEQWAHTLRTLLLPAYIIVTPGGTLAVPLGEERAVRWGGTGGGDAELLERPACAEVRVQGSEHQILVSGARVGEGALRLSIEGQAVEVPIICRKWAARIGDAPAAFITGDGQRTTLVRQALVNAALSAAEPEPGAHVELEEVAADADHLRALVVASGPEFFTAKRQVLVRTKLADAPRGGAAKLVVSNYPERVSGPGPILRYAILGQEPTRLLWHHVNVGGEPLRLRIRLTNLGQDAALIHLAMSEAGPLADEIGAGHRAMVRYLQDAAKGRGVMLRIPSGCSWDLVDSTFRPTQVLSGLAQISVLQGAALALEVGAEPAGGPTDLCFHPAYLTQAQLQKTATPYDFDAEKPIRLTHIIGGAWTFLPIGRDTRSNQHGRSLAGEYGVSYDVTLTVRNDKDVAAPFEIALRGGGGAGRGTFVIDGNVVETGLLVSGIEEVLAKGTAPARSEKTVHILTIPESGTYYPVTLQVRSARN